VPEDDRAVMERLAALEAEVKADADKQRARKDAALAKLREQKAARDADNDAMKQRQTALVAKSKPAAKAAAVDDEMDSIGGALELAKKAHGVKQELAKGGEKSWVKSGVASLLLGPLGWLYAGSLREAIPASAAWLAFGALATKIIPMFLLMPVLLVALPLSGIAGVVYALQFNRSGKRQRLFNKDSKKPKQLPR
jgi:hypothetical protein